MLIVVLYVLLICFYLFSWLKEHYVQPVQLQHKKLTNVTIIIPFKNEKDHLPLLIECLKQQSYSSGQVQFLLVNDNSTDGSQNISPAHPQFQLLHNDSSGKKSALIYALKYAKGDLVISLDADCKVGREWLSTIVNNYEVSDCDMMILPVVMEDNHTLWGRMQMIESQSLWASTAAAAIAKRPIMCNGANLAYKRSLIADAEEAFNTQYASGDDMFLLEYAKRNKSQISYLKNIGASAFINPESWSKFWRQRFRWTSKSGGYTDIDILLSGALVFLANLSLLVLLCIDARAALFAFILKGIVDLIFLYASSSFWGTRKFLWLSLLITPLYPFYVLCATVGGLFHKKWK